MILFIRCPRHKIFKQISVRPRYIYAIVTSRGVIYSCAQVLLTLNRSFYPLELKQGRSIVYCVGYCDLTIVSCDLHLKSSYNIFLLYFESTKWLLGVGRSVKIKANESGKMKVELREERRERIERKNKGKRKVGRGEGRKWPGEPRKVQSKKVV